METTELTTLVHSFLLDNFSFYNPETQTYEIFYKWFILSRNHIYNNYIIAYFLDITTDLLVKKMFY